MQDLHRADLATVEYFRRIVACLRSDDGLREELMEVDQIVRMEQKVVPHSPEPEVGGLRFRRQSWVGMGSLCCWPHQSYQYVVVVSSGQT
jgi:hypothetical protein